MKMRMTVGAEATLMCQKRSAPPDAVEDAPSLDPWLKAASGGRLAIYVPDDGAARAISVLCLAFLSTLHCVQVIARIKSGTGAIKVLSKAHRIQFGMLPNYVGNLVCPEHYEHYARAVVA